VRISSAVGARQLMRTLGKQGGAPGILGCELLAQWLWPMAAAVIGLGSAGGAAGPSI
jgi:hypothetical protein